jgi:hypothetical protein
LPVLPVLAACPVSRVLAGRVAAVVGRTSQDAGRYHPTEARGRRWRLALASGTGPAKFWTPGEKDHGAQRSGPRRGNEVLALLYRTGTGPCPVGVTGTSLCRGFRLWAGGGRGECAQTPHTGKDQQCRAPTPATTLSPTKRGAGNSGPSSRALPSLGPASFLAGRAAANAAAFAY